MEDPWRHLVKPSDPPDQKLPGKVRVKEQPPREKDCEIREKNFASSDVSPTGSTGQDFPPASDDDDNGEDNVGHQKPRLLDACSVKKPKTNLYALFSSFDANV